MAELAASDGATLFFGVPTMYVRLAASPVVGELGRLRLCVSGSAPLDAELWHTLAATSGQRVLERYGMTETVMNVSNPYDGDRRPGSVGLPLPGVQVRLAGAGPDPGEILVRGPNVARAYWERPDATAAAFDEAGWFLTGDIGAFDDDGYLRIVGRSKELIITGGYNVYPREIEEVLTEHPAVAEAAVVGEPSAEWGERVVAVVVAADRGRRGHAAGLVRRPAGVLQAPACGALRGRAAPQRARQGGPLRAAALSSGDQPAVAGSAAARPRPSARTRAGGRRRSCTRPSFSPVRRAYQVRSTCHQ